MVTPRYTSFRVIISGQSWSGDWYVDGKDVVVGSAWGHGRGPLGRRKPEKVAEDLLTAIVALRA